MSTIPGMAARIQRMRRGPILMPQETGIVLPLSPATSGRRTLDTPFLQLASALPASISRGNGMPRRNGSLPGTQPWLSFVRLGSCVLTSPRILRA